MAKSQRTIPTLDNWGEAVDQVYYAKGTDIEVVKEGSKNRTNDTTYVHNKGAQPLFQYKNAKGKIGDWYAKVDTTEVQKVVKAKGKNGPVTTTKAPTKLQELAELNRLATKFGIEL